MPNELSAIVDNVMFYMDDFPGFGACSHLIKHAIETEYLLPIILTSFKSAADKCPTNENSLKLLQSI